MDILFKVMDNENDVTLTDGKGIVIRISDSYEKHYGVTKEDIIGNRSSAWRAQVFPAVRNGCRPGEEAQGDDSAKEQAGAKAS